MTPRIEERQRAERRAARRKLGIGAGIVFLLGLLSWTAFFSPLFALRADEVSVETHGDGVDPAAVHAIAAGYAGTPLTRLGVGELETQINEITAVLSTDVQRVWPHGLAVTVTARVPVAAVPSEGSFELYDAEGVTLRSSSEAPEGLPVIETEVGTDTGRTIGAALTVLGEIPEVLRADIATISATSEQTITFVLTDGATVKWGDASENDLKAAVLQRLREFGATMFDVSAPRTPVTS